MRPIIITIGACVFVGGVALLAQRALLTHHVSLWTSLRVADLWYTLGGAGPDRVAWLGLAGVLTWFLDLPLSLVLAIVGIFTVWLAFAGKRQH